jgi:hypothetical protein
MATIVFTNATLGGFMYGQGAGVNSNLIFSSASGTWTAASGLTYGNVLAGGAAGQNALYIYKGSPPTSFSSFTDTSQRASDLLITFLSAALTTAVTDGGNVNNVSRRFTICKQPTAVAATGTGTATWFLTCNIWDTSLTNKSAIMGTVGGTGSGADLIFSNPNITAGTSYTSLGFNINFPYEWTV